MQETDHMLAIHIAETPCAFRVNGVTIAKRHLAKTLGNGEEVDEKTLAKYLVIVPFLAMAFELPEDAKESVRYGAIKAKRIYEAVGLNEDTTAGFMMVFMQIAEVNPGKNGVRELSNKMREAGFYGEKSFQLGNRQSPRKTLH